jgi:hypothetical protein
MKRASRPSKAIVPYTSSEMIHRSRSTNSANSPVAAGRGRRGGITERVEDQPRVAGVTAAPDRLD